MRYVIAAVVVAVGYSVWVLSEVPQPKKNSGIEMPARLPAPFEAAKSQPAPAVESESVPAPSPERVEQITHVIERLSNELAEMDQELKALGYPDVMLDERLSEAERERIVDKVVTASRIHNVITMLTLKRIDLQAGL